MGAAGLHETEGGVARNLPRLAEEALFAGGGQKAVADEIVDVAGAASPGVGQLAGQQVRPVVLKEGVKHGLERPALVRGGILRGHFLLLELETGEGFGGNEEVSPPGAGPAEVEGPFDFAALDPF